MISSQLTCAQSLETGKLRGLSCELAGFLGGAPREVIVAYSFPVLTRVGNTTGEDAQRALDATARVVGDRHIKVKR